MSVIRWESEWHLTPSGWVQGSSGDRLSVTPPTVVAPPPDRVETWRTQEVENEQYVVLDHVDVELIWFRPDVAEADRAALRARFAPQPWTTR